MFTYSEDVISDLHKDAYGFRPSQRFFDDWSTYTPAEKQECWDIMCRDMEQAWAEEKVQEASDVNVLINNAGVLITGNYKAENMLETMLQNFQSETLAKSRLDQLYNEVVNLSLITMYMVLCTVTILFVLSELK